MNSTEDSETSSNPFADQDIIAVLKFFSKIKKGEKLYITGTNPSTCEDCLTTSIFRTLITLIFKEESRKATFVFINNKIQEAFSLISKSEDNKKNDLLDAIEESKIGIGNLIKTYQSDTYFVSQLEALLLSIDRGVVLQVKH